MESRGPNELDMTSQNPDGTVKDAGPANLDLVRELTRKCQPNTLFGQQMLQSYAGLVLYEKLLTEHKDRIKWIVEIGTATGMLSLYFATWSKLYGWNFLTVDNKAAQHAWPVLPNTTYLLRRLIPFCAVEGDCFDPEIAATILNNIIGEPLSEVRQPVAAQSPGLLFCDGGNKAKELSIFGPACAPGSIIITHDYPIEINHKDIAAISEVEYYQPWHGLSIQGGTKAAVLIRTPLQLQKGKNCE